MNTKKIYSDERKQRNNFLFPRSSFFSLVISVFCLSLFFLFTCQIQTQKSNEKMPAAKTETVTDLPKVTQIDGAGLKNAKNLLNSRYFKKNFLLTNILKEND